jgi:voltage-gated potassium channel
VLPTDAENLYVVLSARGLNTNLLIVARAGEEGSEQKLHRAGADRVVTPYHIGGLRMAQTVLNPAVVDS